ncbi:hypothetical protein [Aeromicrobium sp. 179-A 4D2 NHS]|uniref:hypothetical protein n=1 Tax=Aeromicrobium sp. 179-A 4D2 NHS TaxID=3142375 RepID=UPI0039A13BD9
MGHESVTGTTFEGTTDEALTNLVWGLMDDHHAEYGHSHSVRQYYTVRPGVATVAQAFNADPYSCEWAQKVYSDDDVVVKTHRVSLPVSDLSVVSNYGAVEALVKGWAKENGKQVRRYSLAEDVQAEGLPKGVTGKAKVVHEKSEGEVVSFYGVFDSQTGGRMLAKGDTAAEAKKAAEAFLIANASDRWMRYSQTFLRKVTTRDGSEALFTSKVVLSRGKIHLDVEVESVRKGAVAKGWAVSLDCHM